MALVPAQLIDTERHCPAFRRTREVVLVDFLRLPAPRRAVIPEIPDQLLFLGVDADDGPPCGDECLPLGGDVPKLPVPLGAIRPAQPLLPLIGLERVPRLLEQPPHYRRTRRMALLLEPFG